MVSINCLPLGADDPVVNLVTSSSAFFTVFSTCFTAFSIGAAVGFATQFPLLSYFANGSGTQVSHC